ncbi:MAG TPA: hypothetical protein VN914_20260 [Polyangia bacterium]|nr:hypothetical protein [Polyangia bacterium]
MNIEELEAELPNGFHDARLREFSSDPAGARGEFILDVWIGDLHSPAEADRERRRPARLELLGLAYLVVDDPEPRYPGAAASPVQIEACAADDNPELARQVPKDGFAGRFFVTEWNAFIHFAAREARLSWIEVN